MPDRMQLAMHTMIREDWLGGYTQLSFIDSTLNRMSKRMRFENKLYGSVAEIEDNYELMEAGFLKLYPDLIDMAQQDEELGLFSSL